MSDFVEGKIAFQGELGANSHAAAKAACPSLEPLPCQTFEDAFAAVASGKAVRAMIAIENTLAGRVGDVHRHPLGTAASRGAANVLAEGVVGDDGEIRREV